MTVPLVLSLFPGIGLLDMAFELEGFCVVRGPDLLWGGDVRRFHPPAGVFAGVIGGPPCQLFGGLANFAWRWLRQPENLIPEYERVVAASHPRWFVMENVPGAPIPAVTGYVVRDQVLNNRWFGEVQDRERRFSFGTRTGHRLVVDGLAALEAVEFAPTVTSAHGGGRPRMRGRIQSVSLAEALRLQGAPDDFYGPRSPFTVAAQKKMVVEGVPLPMGRAVARAVKRAMGYSEAVEVAG
jgi:DNA (cytosine-5)-methyltransferase 1